MTIFTEKFNDAKETSVQEIKTLIQNMEIGDAKETTSQNIKTTSDTINTTVNTLKTEIANLKSTISSLSTTINNMSTKINSIQTSVSSGSSVIKSKQVISTSFVSTGSSGSSTVTLTISSVNPDKCLVIFDGIGMTRYSRSDTGEYYLRGLQAPSVSTFTETSLTIKILRDTLSSYGNLNSYGTGTVTIIEFY